MKRTRTGEGEKDKTDDLLPEYRFDYTAAKPNRFAGSAPRRRIAVVLDEDVAEVFATTESVNKALRAIILALPHAAGHRDR